MNEKGFCNHEGTEEDPCECTFNEEEFNLSDKVIPFVYKRKGDAIPKEDVKEFINRLLTPNNISKGFVEVSTIRYYAGDKLIGEQEDETN